MVTDLIDFTECFWTVSLLQCCSLSLTPSLWPWDLLFPCESWKIKNKGTEKKNIKRKASLQSEERQAESSTSLACEMHLNQSHTKSHQWQLWKKHKIIFQVTVPVMISWSLKSAMLLCFHSLTKHTWITCSQTEPAQYHPTVWVGLVWKSAYALPHQDGFSLEFKGCVWTQSPVRVQLGCPHWNCPQQNLPPGQGAQRFCISSDGKNFCMFQQNHFSPWSGNSKIAFHP